MEKYSDEENEILAFTGDTPHNTVTPIARRKDEAFEIDIVLRNNRASEDIQMEYSIHIRNFII